MSTAVAAKLNMHRVPPHHSSIPVQRESHVFLHVAALCNASKAKSRLDVSRHVLHRGPCSSGLQDVHVQVQAKYIHLSVCQALMPRVVQQAHSIVQERHMYTKLLLAMRETSPVMDCCVLSARHQKGVDTERAAPRTLLPRPLLPQLPA